MIRIDLKEPDRAAWRKWREEAKRAAEDLVAAVRKGEKPKIDNDLYKAEKKWLLQEFHGKCAYCEVRMDGNQYGDVEHFRPKKAVVDDDGRPAVDSNGNPHPGYYWLAYEWRNLLPACVTCNQEHKKNRFPVKGARAFNREELATESPFLLHPLEDDPVAHFTFAPNGIVGPKTEEGRKTIDVLGLNRDGLIEGRRETYRAIRASLKDYFDALTDGDNVKKQAALAEIAAYQEGRKPFSAVGRTMIGDVRAQLAQQEL